MQPTMEDVQQMVAALMTMSAGLERAPRRSSAATTLALLYVVASHPNIRPSAIAPDLSLHQSTVSRQVRALAKAGHVLVTVDPDDRRSCIISLTDRRAEEIRRLIQIGLGRFAKFVANWDVEDVATLTRLLWKLEESKAEVARREQGQGGRPWQHAP